MSLWNCEISECVIYPEESLWNCEISECVIHPEVILCSWQDIQIQKLTDSTSAVSPQGHACPVHAHLDKTLSAVCHTLLDRSDSVNRWEQIDETLKTNCHTPLEKSVLDENITEKTLLTAVCHTHLDKSDSVNRWKQTDKTQCSLSHIPWQISVNSWEQIDRISVQLVRSFLTDQTVLTEENKLTRLSAMWQS